MSKNRETVTIFFSEGKAFLEVSPNYLLCIGDEAFIRELDQSERWALVHAIFLELKNGTKQMPIIPPMSKLVH